MMHHTPTSKIWCSTSILSQPFDLTHTIQARCDIEHMSKEINVHSKFLTAFCLVPPVCKLKVASVNFGYWLHRATLRNVACNRGQ